MRLFCRETERCEGTPVSHLVLSIKAARKWCQFEGQEGTAVGSGQYVVGSGHRVLDSGR